MTDETRLDRAERDARENAKDHDRYAVLDADGGYEYTRTRDVADFLRRLEPSTRIVNLEKLEDD